MTENMMQWEQEETAEPRRKLKAKVVTVALAFGEQENKRLIITPDTKTWHVVMRLGYGPHFELSRRKYARAFRWNEGIWLLVADGDELVLTIRGYARGSLTSEQVASQRAISPDRRFVD